MRTNYLLCFSKCTSARMSHVKWVHNFCVLPFFFRLCQPRVSSLYERSTDYPWHATPLSCFICVVQGCSLPLYFFGYFFCPLISLLNFFALFLACVCLSLGLGWCLSLPTVYRLASVLAELIGRILLFSCCSCCWCCSCCCLSVKPNEARKGRSLGHGPGPGTPIPRLAPARLFIRFFPT